MSESIPAPWSRAKKAIFFFILVFFCLNMAPFSLLLHLTEGALTDFIASHVFGLKVPLNLEGSGSGDKAVHYVELFISFCAAVLLTPLLLLIFGRRTDFNTLQYWFNVFVRYYLANMMVAYGAAKLFYMQFGPPSFEQLLQPYGNSSPMGVAWRFMGYSTLYSAFAGLAEILGGLLLFFRKTTLLGATIVFGVMLNVMMMNYSYDIPVKLFSTQLVVMAFYLMLPDAGRIWKFFVLGKEAPAAGYFVPDYKNTRGNRIAYYILKSLAMLLIVGRVLGSGIANLMDLSAAPEAPLCGIYHVISFRKNSISLPPLATDTTRWKTLVINNHKGFGSIRFYNDSVRMLAINVDTIKNKLELLTKTDKTRLFDFSYRHSGDHLVLKGIKSSDTLEIALDRYDEKNFRLISRGFHWINEQPYNR